MKREGTTLQDVDYVLLHGRILDTCWHACLHAEKWSQGFLMGLSKLLKVIRERKNWTGHSLRRECLLTDAVEGIVCGKILKGRRRYKLIDDIKGSGMSPLKVPWVQAVRRECCTSVQSLALCGDGALDSLGSVALIAPAFLGLKSGKTLQPETVQLRFKVATAGVQPRSKNASARRAFCFTDKLTAAMRRISEANRGQLPGPLLVTYSGPCYYIIEPTRHKESEHSKTKRSLGEERSTCNTRVRVRVRVLESPGGSPPRSVDDVAAVPGHREVNPADLWHDATWVKISLPPPPLRISDGRRKKAGSVPGRRAPLHDPSNCSIFLPCPALFSQPTCCASSGTDLTSAQAKCGHVSTASTLEKSSLLVPDNGLAGSAHKSSRKYAFHHLRRLIICAVSLGRNVERGPANCDRSTRTSSPSNHFSMNRWAFWIICSPVEPFVRRLLQPRLRDYSGLPSKWEYLFQRTVYPSPLAKVNTPGGFGVYSYHVNRKKSRMYPQPRPPKPKSSGGESCGGNTQRTDPAPGASSCVLPTAFPEAEEIRRWELWREHTAHGSGASPCVLPSVSPCIGCSRQDLQQYVVRQSVIRSSVSQPSDLQPCFVRPSVYDENWTGRVPAARQLVGSKTPGKVNLADSAAELCSAYETRASTFTRPVRKCVVTAHRFRVHHEVPSAGQPNLAATSYEYSHRLTQPFNLGIEGETITAHTSEMASLARIISGRHSANQSLGTYSCRQADQPVTQPFVSYRSQTDARPVPRAPRSQREHGNCPMTVETKKTLQDVVNSWWTVYKCKEVVRPTSQTRQRSLDKETYFSLATMLMFAPSNHLLRFGTQTSMKYVQYLSQHRVTQMSVRWRAWEWKTDCSNCVLCYNTKMGSFIEDLQSVTPSASTTALGPEESLQTLHY
ncbi:hypothetical protein PR048_016218 [Dryococelus australis]|uniref:Uncharacterized protein n=1 Tax=Dryococelus australis TaxID=614101 RepID=A0ABQ9HJQ2_9NEOP|nr:hypothetical protein PR048_016218 [Dryococelus australis]